MLPGYKEASLKTKPEKKKVYQKNKNPTQARPSGTGTFDTKGTEWAINHSFLFIHIDLQDNIYGIVRKLSISIYSAN